MRNSSPISINEELKEFKDKNRGPDVCGNQNDKSERLINVSIYVFNQDNVLTKRIEALEAEISGNPWIVHNGFEINLMEESKRKEFPFCLCL